MNELLSLAMNYNWLALTLWAAAFVIIIAGLLAPLTGTAMRLLWDFINECKDTPNMFFKRLYKHETQAELDVKYEQTLKESGKADNYLDIYSIGEHKGLFTVIHTKTGRVYDKTDDKFWSEAYSESGFATRDAAIRWAQTFPSRGIESFMKKAQIAERPKAVDATEFVIKYLVTLGAVFSGLVAIGVSLNFLMYPTLLIGSIVITVYGMRSLRRVQKKTSNVLAALKAHSAMVASEAHPNSSTEVT